MLWMSEIFKTASRQVEESLATALTSEEQKKIALQIGSVLLAGGLLVAGKTYQWLFPGFESITGIIMFIGAVVAGFDIFIRAISGFISYSFKNIMEQLVCLALLASIAKGDYQTAILLPLIMSIVHFFEERSILGAQSAIEGLKTLQVKMACLVTGAGENMVDTKLLKPGDLIVVRPGEMIPVDGEITEGESSIDQSSLTGETIPVDVEIGHQVYAGTVNMQGLLKICVLKRVTETSLNKIVELLKKTEQSKISTLKIIEKYSSYYLPLVIIIAIGAFFITQDMDRVIAILVVACPCAQILVSSTAMVAALSVSSRNGILLKSTKFLEVLGDVKTVIFDKTGTVTAGQLETIEIRPVKGVAEDELLKTAATAAWVSNHPVSRAIVRAARDLSFEKNTVIKENAGLGVTAEACLGKIQLGKRDWFVAKGLLLPEEPAHYGSVVWVACNDNVLGCILLADCLREDAQEAVAAIRELDVERIVLVTGDRREPAEIIQNELGLDEVFANCMPSEKLKIVAGERQKQGKTITMVVGDGINDALALSEADVGVAMGAMGSDIAVQSADIALMGNELKKLSFIIGLSRKTKRIIYQNMIIALLSSCIMLMLAGVGLVRPLLGAFLHNIGAFMVLVNSARLLNYSESV
jgi:Cd2+/Zn2+-exporting ATPase